MTALGRFPPDTNYATGQFQNDTLIEQIAYAENGSFTAQREVKSTNFAVQSGLWEDRIISLLGWRHDEYRARRTTVGAITQVDGTVVAPALTATQICHYGNGQADYDLVMNRWARWDKLAGETKTLGGVFRPLKGWSRIERSANKGIKLQRQSVLPTAPTSHLLSFTLCWNVLRAQLLVPRLVSKP